MAPRRGPDYPFNRSLGSPSGRPDGNKEKKMVSIILPLVLIVGFLALSLAYLRD